MTDELRFDGQVAIVTGAGSGLGREHALLLARRGAAVVVNDIGVSLAGDGGSDGPASAVVREITAAGGTAVVDGNSVATEEGGRAIVERALESFGRIDVVVNNAGIIRDKSFLGMTPELVDPVLDVHLRGAFHVTRAAWGSFRDQGYGRVVLTTSTSGLFGNFGQANYAAAKTGLVGLMRVLAIEGAKYGIKVNAIAPGAATRMTPDGVVPDPSKLSAAQVAPVVAVLAHESCPVTGEVFRAAGGRVARIFIGITPGIREPDLTPELVLEQFDAICDLSTFDVPATAGDVG